LAKPCPAGTHTLQETPGFAWRTRNYFSESLYVDFIDVYAEIREDEREALLLEMTNKEDTVMLAQYIRDKGKLEGRLEGERVLLERLLTRRFGILPDWGRNLLASATVDQLDRWADRVLDADSIQAVLAE
jgi:hypothetical protein